MTITVTSIVATGFNATGLVQELPFAFKVFTPSEIEVFYGANIYLTLNTHYTVESNTEASGAVLEGGSVTLLAGVVPAGQVVTLVANPNLTQDQIYTNAGTRISNLNEALDRATLRALRARYEGALEAAGSELLDLAAAAGAAAGSAAAAGRATTTFDNVDPNVGRLALGAASNAVVQSTAGARTRTLVEKLRSDVRSILDFCSPSATATENTARLNAALAQSWCISAYGAEASQLRFNGTIVLPTGAALIGPLSGRCVLVFEAGDYPSFKFTGSYTTLTGFFIDDSLKTGGTLWRWEVPGDLEEVRIEDLQSFRSWGFGDDTGVVGKYLRTYVNRNTCFALRGEFMNFTRAWAFNEWGRQGANTPDYNGSPNPNFTAFKGTGGSLGVAEGGLYIYAHVLGAGQRAYDFTDMPAVTIAPGSTADSCVLGSRFDGGANLSLQFVNFSLANDEQVIFIDTLYAEGWIIARGRRGQVGAAAAKNGVTFGPGNATFDFVIRSYDNTGNGIEQASPTTTQINILGGRSTNNGLKGLKTSTAGAMAFSSMMVTDNLGGNGQFGGPLHQVLASMNGAGAPLNVSGVAVF